MTEWKEILKKADEWRHLPAYRMEPRVDLFFALFLKDVLMETFDDCKIEDSNIIPEFPLKNKCTNHSSKVDFAVFCEYKSKNTIFLVELKTDMSSINPKQLEKMICVKRDCSKLLSDVQTLADLPRDNETYAQKYAHLKDKIKCITDRGDWCQPKVELVLIAPEIEEDKCFAKYDGFTTLSFQEFVKSIRKNVSPDESSLREEFACKLEEWACVKPGEAALSKSGA